MTQKFYIKNGMGILSAVMRSDLCCCNDNQYSKQDGDGDNPIMVGNRFNFINKIFDLCLLHLFSVF